MSVLRCDTHDRYWDSDYTEECPVCAQMDPDEVVVIELERLANFLSPSSGAGTDHAIRCECGKCAWADDIRAGIALIRKLQKVAEARP